MKKLLRSIFFFFLIFSVFSCDELRFPKEVEIKKTTPELRFNADMDDFNVSDIFGELNFDIGNEDLKIKMLDCNNIDTLTYLIYAELYNEDLQDDAEASEVIGRLKSFMNLPFSPLDEFEVPDLGELLIFSSYPIPIKAPDFSGTPLDGFKLKPIIARVYMSGDNVDFMNTLEIRLDLNGEKNFGASESSGISFDDTDYFGIDPPAGTNQFELEFSEELEVAFKVYIKGGETIYASWLDEPLPILLEFVLWFPCEFEVGPGGAEFDLPFGDMFSDGGDFFGRSSEEDDSFIEYIEDANIAVKFNKNPFLEAELIVTSAGAPHPIENNMTSDSLQIIIDKDAIGYPFIPEFKLKFYEGETVAVPRSLTLEEFVFSAALNIVLDVPEIPKIKIPEGWKLF